MRMLVTPALAPAAPRRGSLLRDPDHHHAEAAIALGRGEVLARDLLLDIVLLEAHLWDLVLGEEPLDRLDVRAADPSQHHWRWDREAAIEQKPDHLKLGLQARHMSLKEHESTDRTWSVT
jgi:hypothetical protein